MTLEHKLEPKHEYSALILSDMIDAIEAKYKRLVGNRLTRGIVYSSFESIGTQYANKLMKALGIKKGGNAATAVSLITTAANILGLDFEIVKTDARCCEFRVLGQCPYGLTVSKRSHGLTARYCFAYMGGIVKAVDDGMHFKWVKKMCSGDTECYGVITIENPRDDLALVPSGIRVKYLPSILSKTVNKTGFLVDTLSSFLFEMGEKAVVLMGHKASLIPASSHETFAGATNSEDLRSTLSLGKGVKNSAVIVKEVREAIGAKVKIVYGRGIMTAKCPLAKCGKREGNFVKMKCISYTNGLLSSFGDYEIEDAMMTGCHKRSMCRQLIVKQKKKVVKNKEAYEEILDKLVNIKMKTKPINAAAIVTTRGLPVVSKLAQGVDEEVLAELSATIVGAGGTAINELKTGTSDRVILEGSDARVIITKLNEEMLLVVMSDRDANLGMVLLQIGKILEKIKEIDYEA